MGKRRRLAPVNFRIFAPIHACCTNMGDEFTEVPVVDYSLSQRQDTKAEFLSQLRNAIVNVGFFYLSNHSIPEEVQQAALEQSDAFFNLPLQQKLDIDSSLSKHFLGYNRMNAEKTVAIVGRNESVFVSFVYCWQA